MRPRKRVLLYSADQLLLSEIGFALRLGLYAVTMASNGDEVRAALQADTAIECALVMCPHAEEAGEALVQALRAARPELRTILAVRKGAVARTQAHLLCSGLEMAMIREAMHLICARKRGPKTPHAVQAVGWLLEAV